MNQKIIIPDLDERVVQRLKQLAWQSGLPLEEALRRLLIDAAYSHEPRRLSKMTLGAA